MIRFILSLVLGILLVVFTILAEDAALLAYYDIPGFIITVIFPFVLMYVVNGNKTTKAAFSAPFKKNNSKETLVMAHEYFTNYNTVTWLSGVIALITGAIGIMSHLDDVLTLGPFIALILISLLYAALINVFIMLPFKMLIHQKLRGNAEAPSPNPEAVVEVNGDTSAAKVCIRWALRILVAAVVLFLIIVVSVTATIIYNKLNNGDLP